MEQPLADFIHALRRSGVRVSTAETIDALRAIQLIGYADRNILRDALAAVLAKSSQEQIIFANCFDFFFTLDSLPLVNLDGSITPAEADTLSLSNLARLILAGDRGGLAVAMQEAARAVDLAGMQFFTQKGSFIQKILNQVGFQELNRDLEALSAAEGDSSEGLERLKRAKQELFEAVRGIVGRQFDLFAPALQQEAAAADLTASRLSNLEERDFEKMQALVGKMVKRLKTVYSRRRKTARKGYLDFKRTLRQNIAGQGLLFDLRWKTKKIDRPRVVAICDVSRSVKNITRFFLLFLHTLNEMVGSIQTFVFCSNLVEVSRIFAEHPVRVAVGKIEAADRLGLSFGLTDYGRALNEFRQAHLQRLSRKTTVFILGDARNNYDDPRADIVRLIRQKSRRVIWLNPESPAAWGSGDSAMLQYAPCCDLAVECSTLNHLQKIVRGLLKSG